MHDFKLQSAMEYLMTYGWAILIIAIVMVAAFSVASQSGNPLQTACTPNSGFGCYGVVFKANNGANQGQATFSVGQSTGTNWLSANIYYITEQNSSLVDANGTPTQIAVKGGVVSNDISPAEGGLLSGQSRQITIFAPSGTTWKPGDVLSGTIWAQYTTAANPSQFYYVKMASIIGKAS